jgi:hypothetical protein
MTSGSAARRSRLRPFIVAAGVAIAVAGIGGTTGAVIGSAVSPSPGYHHHHEWHGRLGPDGPPPVRAPAPGAPAVPAPGAPAVPAPAPAP